MITQAKKNWEKINNGLLVRNSVKKYLFHALTAVSGNSSAEVGCTLENAWDSFAHQKAVVPGWISLLSFVVDMGAIETREASVFLPQ